MHLAIDFDGTLRQYTGKTPDPTNMEPPVEGSVEWVKEWVEAGHEYSIFTASVGVHKGHEKNISAWLERYGFPAPAFITNVKRTEFDWILDDRATNVHGGLWLNITPRQFKRMATPWWRV